MNFFGKKTNALIQGIVIFMAVLLTSTIIILTPSVFSEYFGDWEKTDGIITNDPSCASVKDTELLSCTLIEVKYKIDGKMYKKLDAPGRIINNVVKKGDKITVWYQKNKSPYDIAFLDEYTTNEKYSSFIFLLAITLVLWLVGLTLH